MSRMKKHFFLAVIAAAAAMGALIPSSAKAAAVENVDIHVSVIGAKSLAVNTTYFDFGALSISASSVSAQAIQVTNTSTVFIETYTITGANAISDSNGTDWALAASTGPNQFALSAQFSDDPPADLDAAWADDALSLSPITCGTDVLGNGTPSDSGSAVMPGGLRQLWFRIKTPSAVSDNGPHTITLTLSVL